MVEPLKNKIEPSNSVRYNAKTQTHKPIFFAEDIKSAVEWLKEWKLYSTGYPYKQKCD